jgi:hypothetical protein
MSELPQRVLLAHAAPEAFAPMCRAILAKLGYSILTLEEFESLAPSANRNRPDLRIVDERNLAEVPEGPGPAVPIIVVTGRHGVTGADPRIVGAVRRPAGLHELFRLIQQVLEDRPRSTPRVPTHLAATCRHDDREWRGAVLSLSENGCLLRSIEPLTLGSRVQIRIELPRSGPLSLAAETAYQLLPDHGMVFHATSPQERAALSEFVTEKLITL